MYRLCCRYYAQGRWDNSMCFTLHLAALCFIAGIWLKYAQPYNTKHHTLCTVSNFQVWHQSFRVNYELLISMWHWKTRRLLAHVINNHASLWANIRPHISRCPVINQDTTTNEYRCTAIKNTIPRYRAKHSVIHRATKCIELINEICTCFVMLVLLWLYH